MNNTTDSTSVQHWYLHIDLDAFFASVEQLDHPEYRGKPVIVGGKPEDRRGVVSTCSYEARKFGVHSAMPTAQAYKLCPQGIFVHGNMSRYHELSYKIMEIFRQYSPDVDQMSIDEAFVDLTGTEKLFGKPEDTALRIKKEVKEKTGLTVSIGLAANKYIAKIASGYSKPNGFHIVQPGKELDFMLSLPLSKLWGAGEKTQQALNRNGIKTTRDLYERDLLQLEFLFGKNSANFLYNAVRGINQDSFSKQTKNHSISNERTFGFDIYDIYTVETYILELSQYVLFRLLKEGGFSRTVFIKIRYEDFSTTSIQQTFDAPILTVDSFYEALINLFEKRFEKGRGIRLIGVGFDNIEKEDNNHQYTLFEEPDEKKQKIEKAILNLENKHPEIKIHKARILTKSTKAILLAFLLLLGNNKTKIYAQETENLTQETTEQPSVLFDLKLNDKDKVDFLVSGYWLMSLEYSANANLGKDFLIASDIPIFKQEVDIYTWLMLNNQWYFEADFADEFKKNTFALGYEGKNILQKGRLSNRKVTMPSYYSAQTLGYGLGGGSNQAPGISLHFQDPVNQKWSGDFLLRYDMTKTQSATYYGSHSVTDSQIDISWFEYGQSFVLPESSYDELQNIDAIYVESKNGTYQDEYKRKYEKLSQTQYMILSSTGRIILSINANASKKDNKIPAVLITFTEQSSVDNIILNTGSYSEENSFTGQIQTYFNKYKEIDLQSFSYSLSTTIENSKALVLQNNYGFSPFLIANTYDAGVISNIDTSIISKYTEALDSNFETYNENQELFTNNDNFSSVNHTYISVHKTNLLQDDFQLPESRYPFGDTNPEIYLNLKTDTDKVLLVRTYDDTTEYNIGTNASKDTVQVYINNILDTLAEYDEKTGIVTLGQTVNENDKVYILWQEDSKQFGGGSLAAGTGFIYNFTPELKLDTSLTFRWPVDSYTKYATVDSPMNGFGAFTTGLTYEKQTSDLLVNVSNKTAISLQTDNPTGVLLVSSQENLSQNSCYLNRNDGFTTKTTPVLTTDYEILCLDETKNFTVQNHTGSTDSTITGYKIPLEWNFPSSEQENWASVDIRLENNTTLANTSTFEIALQPLFATTPNLSDYDVYLQLGITASDEFYGEDSYSIPTWKISEKNTKVIQNLDITSSSWQTISVILNDEDRAKLISNHDARLIVVEKDNCSTASGTIFTGPYEAHKQGIAAFTNSLIETRTDTTISTSSSSKALFSTENYDSCIKWNIDSPELLIDYENTKISAVSYFKAADFNAYKTINFDFAYEYTTFENTLITTTDEAELIFILDSNSNYNLEENNPTLKIYINNIQPYISSDCIYHTLTYNQQTNKVLIDDLELDTTDYKVEFNPNLTPSRQKIIFSTVSNNHLYTKGTFYISNLYYKDSPSYINTQNNFSAGIEKAGPILQHKDYVILEDGKLSAVTNQNFAILSQSDVNNNLIITANGSGEITVTGITLSSTVDTEYKQTYDTSSILKFGGHSIKTKEKLFNILDLSESYNYYKKDSNLKKSDSISLDFNTLKIPVLINTDFSANQTDTLQNQTGILETESSFKIKENTTKIQIKASVDQKLNLQNAEQNFYEINNYFINWYDISNLQFSTGYNEASLRNTKYTIFVSDTYKNVSPSVEYSLHSLYQNKSNSNFTDTTGLAFKIPVTLNRNSFYFNLIHTGIGLEKKDSNTYISDTQNLFTLTGNNRDWFYTAIPFYELFSKEYGNKLLSRNLEYSSEYLLYNTKYEVGWKRKLYNNISDLFVPSSTMVAVSREIKASETLSDLYQFKTVITNTSLNNFGAQSSLKIFNWYEQDELLTGITGIVKLPADFNMQDTSQNVITYQISAYTQLLLFLKNNGIIKNTFDFSFETNKDWNFKTGNSYTRKATSSFLIPLIELCINENKKSDYKISRKDSLNVTLECKEKTHKQKYEYLHSVDVNLFTYYTLNCGAGLDYIHTQNTGDSAGIKLTIGGKMEF